MNHLKNPLRIFETCVLVNNNLWGQLVSSVESPTAFDEKFKVTCVPFFIPGFNMWNCEIDNFILSRFILILGILKPNKILIPSRLLAKNLKWCLLLL